MAINTTGRPSTEGFSVISGLVATGTNQATAYEIGPHRAAVKFGTVASGAGCMLPTSSINGTVYIRNTGANALLIYPRPGGTINDGTVNAPFSLAAASSACFVNFENDWSN